MTPVHRIYLRGPWVLDASPFSPDEPHRVQLPAEWECVLEQASIGFRLSRRFHKPTNLSPAEQVSLVLQKLWPGCIVSLNGVRIGTMPAAGKELSVDVSGKLKPSNVLCLEFQPLTGLRCERSGAFSVCLEIGSVKTRE